MIMVFKLVQAAEKRWRRLNSPKLLLEVYRGKRFVDGTMEKQKKGAA